MTTAVYDKIGKTYDHTRKADPEITQRILRLLAPTKSGRYLDVGCGSGNYTQAIFQSGFQICGLDVSEEMLKKARNKNPQIEWILGDAKKLPFSNDQFDGATCILATHHIKDIGQAFKEIHKVLKKGRFVIFTSSPEQIDSFWLKQYFPKVMSFASNMIHSQEEITKTLDEAGFSNIEVEKFFVTNNLQDWFLHAGKYRPHIYLDPAVRSGMSCFLLENNEEEILKGCSKLQSDISSGKINKIIQAHVNDLGDYIFVTGTKH